MKKIVLIPVGIFLISLSLITLSPMAFAKGYVSFGGGGGGDAGSGNMRIDGGGYTVDKNLNFLIGMGVPYTINRDDTPSRLLEYPVPHTNYTSLGTRKRGEEVGVYAKFGIEPIKNTGVFIFATGGATWGKEIDLAQSNLTGWYYQQSETYKTFGLFGGGIGYFPKDYRFCLQAAYDNRMGVTGSLGFTW